MDKLTDISYIKQLLSQQGFTFSKSLGQNFLINPSVCPRMAQQCGCEGIGVLEIGPGVGVLTRELAQCAKKVVAVELDERLRPVLAKTLSGYDNVQTIFGDIMKLPLAELLAEQFGDMPLVVCANLPYYITSPIIMLLLESRLPIKALTVMVQKEAAVRLCALPGTRECGAVTAAVRYYCQPQLLFEVSRGSFMPSPKVDSAVIRLDIFEQPPVSVCNEKQLFRVIKAAFGQRRKTLPNALSSGLSMDKPTLIAAMERCGLRATARAEELTLEQLAALTDSIFDGSIQKGADE